MPSTPRQQSWSLKRQTWPQPEPGHLETIIESPRTPQKPSLTSPPESPDRTPETEQNSVVLDGQACIRINEKVLSSEVARTQMIWYSHHLAESYHDRERLASKIEQLETVCRSQCKTNASLLEDVRSWQDSYESIEAELIEATQEIEEAKAYVRSIETANANLRYALSQAREEQERARRRRWRKCFADCWDRVRCLPQQVNDIVCGASATKTSSPSPQNPARMIDIPTPSMSRIHLLGSRTCSRMSEGVSQKLEPSETPTMQTSG